MQRGGLLALLCLAASALAAEDFTYVRTLPAKPGAVVIDARALAACREMSLAGARCMPAGDFLGPHNRLPSERELLWVLGTAGLSGKESVLVVGQEARARDFVAGLLYVAGQHSVKVLTEPVVWALERGAAAGPGRERGMIREAVFEVPMRDDLLVLRGELRAMKALLLDGRSEREYWGEKARAARGGHLPGAISVPASGLRATREPEAAKPLLPDASGRSLVAYGHDAFEGFAYLTLLRAGHGVPARLYAEGWAEWAADGALPADSVSYPERAPLAAQEDQLAPAGDPSKRVLLAIAIAMAAFALGWWGARRRRA